jgi:hypothetical protein
MRPRTLRPALVAAPLAAALLASACASTPAAPPAAARPPPAGAGTGTAGAPLARAGYEAGTLAPEARPVAGPVVVTWLAEGTTAALARPGELQPLAVVVGPLATPLHVPQGLELRGTGAPGAWTGYRPQAPAVARPLEAWVGKQVKVAPAGGPAAAAELWWLREVGADHLLFERSRTYRAVPLRRVSEITWTELSGIDPTPLVVVAPE